MKTANPQLENGHIRIANELWNEILRRNFSKRQLNLILFIWRLSYGTGQKDCVVPNFTHFEITGMYKQDVKKELTFLAECSVLHWEQETMVFSINKNYHHWQITPNKKWDNDLFDELIYTNLQRKRQRHTPNSNSQTTKPHPQVSKLLTSQRKAVSKTRTFQLVKHLPSGSRKAVISSDSASVKTKGKTVERKEIKKCNNKKDKAFGELINFYRANLRRGVSESRFNHDLLKQWYEEYGYDLLFAAMKVAAKAEAKGVKYIERVLVNWTEAGVKSVEDVGRLNQRVKKRTKSYQQKPVANKRDVVPDWYVQHKEQRSVKNEPAKTEEEKRQTAAEVDRMLAAYLAGEE